MSNANQEQVQPKRLEGKVKAVLSGDTLVLAHPTRPYPSVEKTLTLVRIRAPRMAKKNEEEEALAFEAREFLRSKCIGKLVTFQVEYKNTQTGKDYGSVFLDGENLGEAVLRAGLAEFKASKREAEEYRNLAEAQEEAKSKKIGIWAEDKKKKEIIWSGYNVADLLKSLKNKPVNVIVEYVVNGSSLRVRLPTGEVVLLHLTGVQSPGIRVEEKRNKDNKPTKIEIGMEWSKEARFYTEARVLHRDVSVLFEDADTKNGSLVGTILISKDEKSEEPLTFQEELLLKGYAKISERTIARCKYASRLRLAENIAKNNKLRIWSNYVPPESTLKNVDKDVFDAQVVEILSGDTVKIRHPDGHIEKISLSDIRAPKLNVRSKDNEVGASEKKNAKKKATDKSTQEAEPWAFEAKDTLRKRVVGRTVQVKVDYRRSLNKATNKNSTDVRQQFDADEASERRFCTLLVNGKSVAVDLVRNGYAFVIKRKSGEERSVSYDELMVAENEAIDKKKGIHAPKNKAPVHRINDITRESAGQASKYLHSLKDKKIKAVVEKVFTGNRYKLLLSKEFLAIPFTLIGVSCPSLRPKDENTPKPFSQEALNFAIDQLMMRDVEIVVKDMDNLGSFTGELYWNNTNFAINLLKNGYAMIQKSAEKLHTYEELRAAEQIAKDAKKNVWSVNPSVFMSKKRRIHEESVATTTTKFKIVKDSKPFTVRVTEILDATHFYIQRADSVDDIQKVEEALSMLNPDELAQASSFEQEQIVLAFFAEDESWYRAKVTKLEKDKGKATVLYIDYGSTETIPLSNIRVLPSDSELLKIKPTAIEVKLALIYLHTQFFVDEAKLLFIELVSDRDLDAKVQYIEKGIQHITLIDKTDNTNINATLVRNGLAFVDTYFKKFEEFKDELAIYEKDQQLAKAENYNLWAEGDVYQSDDEF